MCEYTLGVYECQAEEGEKEQKRQRTESSCVCVYMQRKFYKKPSRLCLWQPLTGGFEISQCDL